MTGVRKDSKKIRVGDQSIPLIGGEVHYWRLDPRHWRDCLLQVKELGLPVVATYVCWDFHELEPGHHDFQGTSDPRRNLLGFLDLVAEIGLNLADSALTGERWRVHDMLSGADFEMDIRRTGRVTVPLARKDGTILRLSPLA